jgi:hypothetical protein
MQKFLKTTREKNGDKTIMVPRLQGEQNVMEKTKCWFVIGCFLLDKITFTYWCFYSGVQYFQSLHFQRYTSRRFCTNSKFEKLDPLHPFRRCDIPSGYSTVQASSVSTTRTFRSILPLCWEALNCSKLHPSGHLCNTSERHLVFDQLWDFFPKHKYGKTATLSGLSPQGNCVHQFNRPDNSLHGPDAQSLDVKIVCS